MLCPSCGATNPEDAFFCGACGAQQRSALGQPQGPVNLSPRDVLNPTGPPAPMPPLGHIEPPRIGSQPPSVLDMPIAETPPAGGAIASPPELPQPPGFPLEMGIAGASFGGGPPQTPGLGEPFGPPPAGAPPAPPQSPYLPPQQQYQQPGQQYQQPGQQYGPPQPPYSAGQQYPTAPPPPGYGYSMPPDGNTSGMGDGYPLPPGVSGFNAGGCVPFGLFGFLNGSMLWGFLGLGGCLFGLLHLISAIFLAIQGRELAWRNKRYDSIEQFQDTMQPWNIWGFVCLGLGVIGIILYFVLVFAATLPAFSEAFNSTTP